ncbi:MAG: GNAT family N-acetyltransferase [Halioglobus sp.]
MYNQALIDQCHEAQFPTDLADGLNCLIEAASALRPLYPPDKLYRVDFGERCLLREVLDPDEHETHWWQTGLYIIQSGIAEHPTLAARLGAGLDHLSHILEERLGPYDIVALREIEESTVAGICLLSEFMTYPQNTFVAPNAYSLAQALFSKNAWYRAVYAGKAPVGFIMLDDDPDKRIYYLWRFMIAPHFQGKGYGAAAIAALAGHVKERPGARELLLSYVEHEQGPAEFYRGLGFSETGVIEDGEIEMALSL